MTRLTRMRQALHGPLWAFGIIALSSVVIAVIAGVIDYEGHSGGIRTAIEASIRAGVLGGFPEVIVGVLAISITVVAIIVELASNRYTARITELFMGSLVNVGILGFFVTTAVLCVWVSIISGHEGYIPRVTVTVTFVFVVLCLLLLLPYFAFVFNFLNPHNIIDRMANSVLWAVHRGGEENHIPERCKKSVVQGIEQLADVASGAIESKDKVVCMHAVDALRKLSIQYLQTKKRIRPNWFLLNARINENPDFVSMQEEVLNDIENGQYWVEMKILRQYQMLYGEALNRMRDINYLLAINTRKIAECAMEEKDDAVVALMIKFFNTYMRATINARDVRTAYNVFNQYRLLASTALMRQQTDVALEVARRFQYYGQLGFSAGIAFVLETAAYDLCELNEQAYRLQSPCRQQLLDIFLDVDKEAEEGHSLEASLRGVRKAQIKLATYYLVHGEDALAATIFEDVKSEIPSRLASIRQELSSITSRDFWEINDRGVNFDYLNPQRRAALDRFFTWFDSADSSHIKE